MELREIILYWEIVIITCNHFMSDCTQSTLKKIHICLLWTLYNNSFTEAAKHRKIFHEGRFPFYIILH
jgi:hypothetical protein